MPNTSHFRVERPSADTLPIVVDVPHAGEDVPSELFGEISRRTEDYKRDLDLYVDRFWVDAPSMGATLVVSEVSRYVIDLNRASDDVSPNTVVGGRRKRRPGYYQDRGVVWRTATDGSAIMPEPLDIPAFDRRIAEFWAPYHEALRAEIDRVRDQFGFCILVDGHSMPSLGRPTTTDRPSRRADIVPGDADGRSCASVVTDTVVEHFRSEGFSVEPNRPYKGGWITRNYGVPAEGIHAIQIEVNRDLYMDELSFEPNEEGIERLRRSCAALLPVLGRVSPPVQTG